MRPDKRTILVVDDECLIRQFVTACLEDRGWTVVEADCAAEAIEIIEQGTAIDLLFTDVRMPGDMNGLDLARWLRRRDARIRILVASGYTGEDQTPGGAEPYDAFLSKPYSDAQIVEQIGRLLAPIEAV